MQHTALVAGYLVLSNRNTATYTAIHCNTLQHAEIRGVTSFFVVQCSQLICMFVYVFCVHMNLYVCVCIRVRVWM